MTLYHVRAALRASERQGSPKAQHLCIVSNTRRSGDAKLVTLNHLELEGLVWLDQASGAAKTPFSLPVSAFPELKRATPVFAAGRLLSI